jgi:lipid-A-disaccharide synthase
VSGPGVLVSTGEPSGDAHAASLVRALRGLVPDLRVEAVGGPQLEAAGATLLARIENLTVLGFVEVVGKIPAHYRVLRSIERRLSSGDIRLVVLVDYPGFHLRVAAAARRAGVPVLYYIAPQLWAWGAGRLKRLARDVTRLAVILPFEEDFFRERGIPATFVGHPLLDRPPLAGHRSSVKTALGLDPARPVLGLFPGSREQEITRMWPLFREAWRLIAAQRPGVQAFVAGVGGAEYPEAGEISVVRGKPRECFAAADAALCKSGTTTLEAALADLPHVVAYRLHPLSYQIARRLVRIPWIGLANLVARRSVTPELIQSAATPAALAAAVSPLLDPASVERREQLRGLDEVRRRLGGPGAALRTAELARGLLAA